MGLGFCWPPDSRPFRLRFRLRPEQRQMGFGGTGKVYESQNEGQARMMPLEGGDEDLGYPLWPL